MDVREGHCNYFYTKGLTKYRRWLPILVYLLMFIKIINIVIISNHYVPQDEYRFFELSINKLLTYIGKLKGKITIILFCDYQKYEFLLGDGLI